MAAVRGAAAGGRAGYFVLSFLAVAVGFPQNYR